MEESIEHPIIKKIQDEHMLEDTLLLTLDPVLFHAIYNSLSSFNALITSEKPDEFHARIDGKAPDSIYRLNQ